MNVNIEENSALRRKLTIEVEPDEIKRELDKTYNELRRGVVLKGFRPGHAPRNLLEKFFGDQVRSEVIQKLVKEYTDKALEENNLKPIVEPEIINEETNLPETLKFSAVFDLKPEVVLKDYEGLKVPEETIAITDQEVDDTIERLRERQASLKKVEGRDVVEEGDVAVVTVEGFEDGKPLSEAKSENRLLEISKKSLAHGVDEVLIGAKVGEENRKTKTYAADYEQKDLAGKTVEWRANVKEIYKKELPPLDDDFAKDQGDKPKHFAAVTVLTDVKVLAVAQRSDDGVAAKSNSKPQPDAKTVTLAVTPEDAQKLFLADQMGTLRLSLHKLGGHDAPQLNPVPNTLPAVGGGGDSQAQPGQKPGGNTHKAPSSTTARPACSSSSATPGRRSLYMLSGARSASVSSTPRRS